MATQSPLSEEQLEKFRQLLLARRQRMLGSVEAMEKEALKQAGQAFSVDHMADHGSDNFEQAFTLSLVEEERKELGEIHAALERVRDKTYGICAGTGEPISLARLEAIPYTRHSIEYQRKLEAGEIQEED